MIEQIETARNIFLFLPVLFDVSNFPLGATFIVLFLLINNFWTYFKIINLITFEFPSKSILQK